MISKATRLQNESESLLDNVFINDISACCSSGVFIEDLSDHFPIFVSLKFTNVKKHERKCVTVFDKRKMVDLNGFLSLRLANFQENNDANMASKELVEAYVDGIRSFSKTYRPCRRKSSIKPWITPGILCSINMKTKLYNKFVRRRNKDNEIKYKKYRNALVETIRNAKRLYFRNSLDHYRQNSKMTWSLLNEIIHKSCKKQTYFPDSFHDEQGHVYSKPEVPNSFNNFFSSIGQKLENDIPKVDIDALSYLNEPVFQHNNLSFQTSSTQVEYIIKSLNSVGGGIDNINTNILLGTYKSILHHLTFFFNLCLKNAVFPNNLKVAVITLLFKGENRDMFSNYRPISLLPIFSKVLEKILYEELLSFLENHKILNPLQFGFRRKHSTYMPLAHMYDQVTQILEAKEVACTLYLDLKKAFDTVSTEILLRKLHFIGIRGQLYAILRSYLTGRSQITKVGDVCSNKQAMKLGVPQGSILGPLLFILYINDIGNISDIAKFYLFADDTAVLIKGKQIGQLQMQINTVVPLISKWFQANRLSLNVSKTHYQIYTMSNTADLNIYFDGTKIEEKDVLNILVCTLMKI